MCRIRTEYSKERKHEKANSSPYCNSLFDSSLFSRRISVRAATDIRWVSQHVRRGNVSETGGRICLRRFEISAKVSLVFPAARSASAQQIPAVRTVSS